MPRRWIAASVLGLAITGGGCMSHRQPVATTVIPPAKMREKLAQEHERLAGPDSPRHLSHTYAGVDVTGEGYFTAFMHVVTGAPSRLYHNFKGDTPIKYAGAMEDTKNPDRRREGMLKLANYRFARVNPIYSKRFDQIASEPAADPTVRAAAIRAMNYSRDRLHTQTFVDALDDADWAVRLEAAKALANLPNEKAIPHLIEHLEKDDNKDVRIAAADALREYKTPEVARALVGVLPERDFSVAFRARESLILMTGRNFRFDEAAWLDYFAKAQKPFI